VAQRVRGLSLGVDDWVTKPCHPEELLARVQAVVRRRNLAETGVARRCVSDRAWKVVRVDGESHAAWRSTPGASLRRWPTS
jgi:DNA-binding response OmpR family regulator